MQFLKSQTEDNIWYIVHTQNVNIVQNAFETSFFKMILKLLDCVFISNWWF